MVDNSWMTDGPCMIREMCITEQNKLSKIMSGLVPHGVEVRTVFGVRRPDRQRETDSPLAL